MKKIALILVLLLLVVDAFPQSKTRPQRKRPVSKWKLAFPGDKSFYYYHTGLLRQIAPGVFRVWFKEVPTDEEQRLREVQRLTEQYKDPPIIPNFMDYEHSLELQDIDCRNQRFRFVEVVYYDQDGRVLHEIKQFSEWFRTVPDSISAVIQKPICKQ